MLTLLDKFKSDELVCKILRLSWRDFNLNENSHAKYRLEHGLNRIAIYSNLMRSENWVDARTLCTNYLDFCKPDKNIPNGNSGPFIIFTSDGRVWEGGHRICALIESRSELDFPCILGWPVDKWLCEIYCEHPLIKEYKSQAATKLILNNFASVNLPPVPELNRFFLTRSIYDSLTLDDSVHWSTRDHRWDYFNQVIKIVKDFNDFQLTLPTDVLEAGTMGVSIVQDCDTLDYDKDKGWNFKGKNPTYLWDMRQMPWPVDKHYKLFIALRVWQHLGDKQEECFNEAKRVSDHIILAVPKYYGESGTGIDFKKANSWAPVQQHYSVPWGGTEIYVW